MKSLHDLREETREAEMSALLTERAAAIRASNEQKRKEKQEAKLARIRERVESKRAHKQIKQISGSISSTIHMILKGRENVDFDSVAQLLTQYEPHGSQLLRMIIDYESSSPASTYEAFASYQQPMIPLVPGPLVPEPLAPEPLAPEPLVLSSLVPSDRYDQVEVTLSYKGGRGDISTILFVMPEPVTIVCAFLIINTWLMMEQLVDVEVFGMTYCEGRSHYFKNVAVRSSNPQVTRHHVIVGGFGGKGSRKIKFENKYGETNSFYRDSRGYEVVHQPRKAFIMNLRI